MYKNYALQGCWSQFKFPVTQQRKNVAEELCIYHSVAHGILSIAGLHVTSRWPSWWCVRVKIQKHFSPLGTKPYFHVNSSKKNSILLSTTSKGRLVVWLQAKNTPNYVVSGRGSCRRQSKYGLWSVPKSQLQRCFMLIKTLWEHVFGRRCTRCMWSF